jgi:hypothetical protein
VPEQKLRVERTPEVVLRETLAVADPADDALLHTVEGNPRLRLAAGEPAPAR